MFAWRATITGETGPIASAEEGVLTGTGGRRLTLAGVDRGRSSNSSVFALGPFAEHQPIAGKLWVQYLVRTLDPGDREVARLKKASLDEDRCLIPPHMVFFLGTDRTSGSFGGAVFVAPV